MRMRNDCFNLYLMAFEDVIRFLTWRKFQNSAQLESESNPVSLHFVIIAVISNNEIHCLLCAHVNISMKGGWARSLESRDKGRAVDTGNRETRWQSARGNVERYDERTELYMRGTRPCGLNGLPTKTYWTFGDSNLLTRHFSVERYHISCRSHSWYAWPCCVGDNMIGYYHSVNF